MSIYTRRGDEGTAGLLSDERVPKNHERIDAFGDIDELTAVFFNPEKEGNFLNARFSIDLNAKEP